MLSSTITRSACKVCADSCNTVRVQAGELKSRIAAFAARWEDLKPKGVPSGDPALILIKMQEYSKQLVDLQVNIRLPVTSPAGCDRTLYVYGDTV